MAEIRNLPRTEKLTGGESDRCASSASCRELWPRSSQTLGREWAQGHTCTTASGLMLETKGDTRMRFWGEQHPHRDSAGRRAFVRTLPRMVGLCVAALMACLVVA